jgi:hypothetical protein
MAQKPTPGDIALGVTDFLDRVKANLIKAGVGPQEITALIKDGLRDAAERHGVTAPAKMAKA